jgi:hypothetical protein
LGTVGARLEIRAFYSWFRRSNIAIEAVEIAPSERAELACELLLDAG